MRKRYQCPICKHEMVPTGKKFCEYMQNKHDIISGCGIRVPYNHTWKFCPICGLPICKMGFFDTRGIDND